MAAINYGVAPTWLMSAPTDVNAATMQGLESGDRLAAARARNRAAAQQAVEFATESQQRAQQMAAQRQQQEQQLAIQGLKASQDARQAAMEFDAQQAIQNELASLGGEATAEQMARVYAMHPGALAATGNSIPSLLREMQPPPSPELQEFDVGGQTRYGFIDPRTGRVSAPASLQPTKPQVVKPSLEEVSTLKSFNDRIRALQAGLVVLKRSGSDQPTIARSQRELQDLIDQRQKFIEQHPRVRGGASPAAPSPEVQGGSDDEADTGTPELPGVAGAPAEPASPSRVIRYDDQGNRL